MGLKYSEIQVPRKEVNRKLQHNPELKPLFGYMCMKSQIRKRRLKRKVL
jgi:hypothetical protein